MKKIFWLLLVVLLIAAGVFAFTNYRSAQLAQASFQNYETVALEEGRLVSTIGATGRVRSSQSAALVWQTLGTVDTVNVAVGDRVEAGEVLATIKQTSLPQNIILAQAELATAQQSLQSLYSDAELAMVNAMQEIVNYERSLKDAQYQLDNFTVPSNQAKLDTMEALDMMKERLDEARAAFEPYRYASVNDSVRQQRKAALDEAQSDYNAAVRRLELEYAVQVAAAGRERARQEYEKWKNGPSETDVGAAEARVAAAEAAIRQAWIESPISGVVTMAQPQPGDQVAPSAPAFRIDNLSTMYVDLQVSEIDINQIQVGQEVTIAFDALRGQEYHGEVTEVAIISAEGASTVNFTVTVELADADEAVRPGMTSEVEIVVAQREDALLVPNQAIRIEEGRQVVYLLETGEDGRQELVPVEVNLGIASEIHSELLGGNLQAGDQVVLNPTLEQDQERANPFRNGPPGRNND